MKHLLILLLFFLINNSVSFAQPEDKGGGGGGLPFHEKHRPAWDRLVTETRKDLIKLDELNTNYFKDFKTNWKECFDNNQAPANLVEIYVNFTVKRQLLALEVVEKFDHECTRKEKRAEKKALKKEKREERCIFQGENKDFMNNFLKSPNNKTYLKLKYDITDEESEKIIKFYQDLL